MQEKILKAIGFIKANFDFFSAPFIDQNEFQKWVFNVGEEKNIRNLTDSLLFCLTNPNSHLTQFIDALIGKSFGPKDRACLRYGDDKRLVDLFEKNKSLALTIYYIASNPAIQKWNDDHRHIVNTTLKINILIKQLNSFKQKSIELHQAGFIKEADLGFNLIMDIDNAIFQYIDNNTKNANLFYKKCSSSILKTKQQITDHWDYKQSMSHLLFLITNNFKQTFPRLELQSFFNVQSELIKSLDLVEKTTHFFGNK